MISSYSVQKRYILLLFFLLPIILSAQKKASTANERELVEAVSKNFVTKAEGFLMEGGLDANLTDHKGQSLLMLAARNDNKELVTLLMKKGADVNYRIGSKEDPNNDRGALARMMMDGRTVLDYGIASGSISMTEFLMKFGAKLDLKNKGLNSSIATASQANNVKMVRYLLSKGAKVSPETGRTLVAWHISMGADPFYGWTKIDENTDFSLVKIWDDYGIDLDDDYLLESGLFRRDRDRSGLRRYMSAYRKWLANSDKVVEEEDDRNQLFVYQSVAPMMEESEMDRIIAEAAQRGYEEQLEQDEITLHETATWNRRVFIFIIIIALIVVAYLLYKRFKPSMRWFFPTQYVSPPSRPTVSTQRQNVTPVRRLPSQNVPEPVFPTQFQPKQKGKLKKTDRLDITAKGWTVDDTLHIEVLFLTVEDMINPISLRNEHEKAVREMIAYIRTLERRPDSEIANLIGKDTLASKLEALWKSIDPANVRSIYKRSLYLLVENYSQRDKRVKLFLEKRNLNK